MEKNLLIVFSFLRVCIFHFVIEREENENLIANLIHFLRNIYGWHVRRASSEIIKIRLLPRNWV